MDILDQAIEFEYLAHKMYSEYAAGAKSQAVKNIFAGLAEDELVHVQYIKALKESSNMDIKPTATMHRIKEIIAAADDSGFLAKEAGINEVLKRALEFEKKAQLHYEKELAGASSPEQKRILEIMAKEEARHYDLINSLMKYLESPQAILESQEFHWHET